MLIQLFIFILLSSGSVFGAVVFNRKFEEVLPLTNVFIITFLFLFGLFGLLLPASYLLIAISFALYLFCFYWLLKYKNIRACLSNILTPGFVLFAILFLLVTYFNFGRMPAAWDEFSHWADVVKQMILKNALSTDASLSSTFKSYPPGVSLFLYFIQRVYSIFAGSTTAFSEWRLSFAYQLLMFSFLFPFLKEYSFQKFLQAFAFFGVIFFLPASVFSITAFSTVYIDPILAFLTAIGFSHVFLSKEKTPFYILQVNLVIFLLVLTKDAGLLFAAFLWIAFALDLLLSKNQNSSFKQNALVAALSSLSILLPKLLWNLSIQLNNITPNFSKPYDFVQFFNVLIGNDDSYRTTVNQNFWDAFFNRTFSVGAVSTEVPVFCYIAFLFLGVLLVYHLYKRFDCTLYATKKSCIITLLAMFFVYFIGLLASYMFKFSEYEGTNLASYNRYLSIGLCFLFCFIAICSFRFLLERKAPHIIFVVVTCCFVLLLSWPNAKNFITKYNVEQSIIRLEPYMVSVYNILAIPEDNASIAMISQDSTAYDSWVIRYYTRPNDVSLSTPFSISIAQPDDGDAPAITVAEMQETLCASYDYFLIYHINDYFITTYSSIFSNPDDIAASTLYRINKETGLLEKVSFL